jgi:hypothetical protein
MAEEPPKSAEELLRRYAAGERDFLRASLPGANLDGTNLRGANLSGANLYGTNLYDADLSDANLDGVDLRASDLSGAHLDGANLSRANLSNVNLNGANLRGANLTLANLRGTCLSGSDLRGANLSGSDFRVAELYGAHLDGAHLDGTLLLNIDLSPLCEADPPAVHLGPSTVDFRSIVKSLGSPNLAAFLQSTGMPAVFVDCMIDRAGAPDLLRSIEMLQSTFIRFGSPDEAFARKLHEALRKNGVTTFLFPEHAVPEEKIGRTRRKCVNERDRVLLICSKSSLVRKGVLDEIGYALHREGRDGGASYYLIPVVLDDCLSSDWAPANVAVRFLELKERIAADFRGWDTDPAKFDAGLLQLIEVLEVLRCP